MPAPTHPHSHTETLANGLRVSLRHASDLTRCTAALQVAAALASPALLTEPSPADQGLTAYVQGHGGQLNVQTREHSTAFFLELPPQAFSGGLDRLCEMLAHLRLNPDDQLHESFQVFDQTGQISLSLAGPQSLDELQSMALTFSTGLNLGNHPPQDASPAGLIRGQTSAHRGLRTFAQDRSRSRRPRP